MKQLDMFEQNAGGVFMPKAKTFIGGRFLGQLIRNGKIVDSFDDMNLVVNEGLNYLLDAGLGGASPLTTWYLGLFEGNYTPVGSDTGASIASNSTESTAFAATTRALWSPTASAAQSVTNSASRASYTFNATKTIYGAFLISNSTLNGTAGKLFAAARFTSPKSVVNADQLLLTYTFSASSV